jgi:hypothetical protein
VAKTRDALKIIDRFTGDNGALRALIEGETLNARPPHPQTPGVILAATTPRLETSQHLFSYTG